MPKYNKLIRDKIPEIIKKNEKIPLIETIDDNTYYKELIKKLKEEVDEFIGNDEAEEIADILEVLEALIKAKGMSIEDINKIKEEKKEKRGGFEKKIFLKEVID